MTKGDKTVIFVSHSNQQIKEFCNHVVWLNKGKVIADSYDVNPVLQAYDKFVTAFRKDRNAVPVYEEQIVAEEAISTEQMDTNDHYRENEIRRSRTAEEKLKHTRSQFILITIIQVFIVVLCFLSGIFAGALIF